MLNNVYVYSRYMCMHWPWDTRFNMNVKHSFRLFFVHSFVSPLSSSLLFYFFRPTNYIRVSCFACFFFSLFHTLSLYTSLSVIFFVGATAFFGSHFGVMCLILGHNCYGVGFSYLSSSIVVSAMFIFYIALAS